jgi:protein PhnA
MSDLPNCPECNSEYSYEDGDMYVCPECGYEWSKDSLSEEDETVVKDMNGNVLNDGDSVTVTKDLKIKGSSSVVKVGTKVKIRLIDPAQNADHDIDCKIPGLGGIKLKSKHVKKA